MAKAIKKFYSIERKKKYFVGDDVESPKSEWIKNGLVEAPKEKVSKPAPKNKNAAPKSRKK